MTETGTAQNSILTKRRRTMVEDAERLRLALEAVPLGTWTYDIDTDEAEASDFCYQVFGWPEPHEVWDSDRAIAAIYEEDRRPVVSALWSCMISQSDLEFEARVIRPDGDIRWIHVKARHVPKDGKLTRVIGVLADITARKIEQAALEESRRTAERRLGEIETLYRTAPIGLAVFDPVGFRYINLNDSQAEIIGLPKEQILGRAVDEIAPIPGLRELFEQVAAGKPVVNYLLEGELPMRPGDHRYWTVNYFPIYAPDGKLLGISAASLEITTQRRAEAALMQSEKIAAVGRLASSISHEINNPLEAVMNLLYLSRTGELPAEASQFLELADSELRRVSQIVTHTLRFYRQATRPTRITCEELVSGVLYLYKARLRNHHITVEKRKRAMHPVTCFEGEVRQVINNLVGNSIDAMPAGGRLLMRSRDGRNWKTGEPGLIITVADTGVGMDPAIRKKIFEPFFTTKGIAGTGLGLWISSELVRKHGGFLHMRSSRSNDDSPRGTVMQLFLPRIPLPRSEPPEVPGL